jgi:hypothetical protein
MRWTALSMAAMCVSAAALATPAYVNELMLPAGGVSAEPQAKASSLPVAKRGQYLGVACTDIEQADRDAVRVIMSFAKGEAPGYGGVLATEMTITDDTVHVRVPDTPDIADHTMRVKVFYVDTKGRHACDAGKVKIV